jgi:hypothetical protein
LYIYTVVQGESQLIKGALFFLEEGEEKMGDHGKNDKGKHEQKKAPKLTIKEKRKAKEEKKQQKSVSSL